MGKTKIPQQVKLVIGMLAKNKKLFDIVEEFFVKEYGPIDYMSSLIPFKYTDYYKKEMGHPLNRKFISFKERISPERLPQIKLTTNSLENDFSIKKNDGSKRQINIDPGYLSDAKFVLATTKDYCHRLYLRDGIYGEVTLMWRKTSFQPTDWTYPDYRAREYIDVLDVIRGIYVEKH